MKGKEILQKLCDLIKDKYYPKNDKPVVHRKTVKAVLLNEKNEFCLIHMVGKDMFGDRDHYELPGGGVIDGEDFNTTFKREILEEVGWDSEVISYIGTIEIEYNLLNRIDEGNFYLGRILSKRETHLEDYEKELFKELIFVPFEKLECFYKKHEAKLVGEMIHRRDYLVLKKAKEMLENNLVL